MSYNTRSIISPVVRIAINLSVALFCIIAFLNTFSNVGAQDNDIASRTIVSAQTGQIVTMPANAPTTSETIYGKAVAMTYNRKMDKTIEWWQSDHQITSGELAGTTVSFSGAWWVFILPGTARDNDMAQFGNHLGQLSDPFWVDGEKVMPDYAGLFWTDGVRGNSYTIAIVTSAAAPHMQQRFGWGAPDLIIEGALP